MYHNCCSNNTIDNVRGIRKEKKVVAETNCVPGYYSSRIYTKPVNVSRFASQLDNSSRVKHLLNQLPTPQGLEQIKTTNVGLFSICLYCLVFDVRESQQTIT